MRPDPTNENDDVTINDDDDALDCLGNGGNAVPPRHPYDDNPETYTESPRAYVAPSGPPPCAEIDRRYKRNAEVVAALGDDDVRRILAEVTLGNTALADFVAKRNPRTCPSCRRLIVDRLDQREREGR